MRHVGSRINWASRDGRRAGARRQRRRVTTLGLLLPLLLLLGLLLSSCSFALAPTTPTATPSPAPRFTPVATLLGPPPADCVAHAPPQTMVLPDDFGGGFHGSIPVEGSPPVWELGIGPGEGGSPFPLETQGYTPYPGVKVMWLVGPNFAHPVTLEAKDPRTGAALWFDVGHTSGSPPSGVASPHGVLDPHAPNRGSTDNRQGHWNIWGIIIFFPAAGCYTLQASWPGGHWTMTFAAGHEAGSPT